jgi:HSP20 family protein
MMSLRQAMDQLFEESVVRAPAGASGGTGLALDVAESEGEVRVQATLPGVKPEDIDISVLGDTLRISGEVKAEAQRQGERWLLRERRQGRFERAITLPMPIKAEAVTASFDHGILTVTLPKADVARPRQIKVGAGSGANTVQVDAGTSGSSQAQ